MSKASKKTRKRRTFWEPESKELQAWLKEQDNLGLSLQLLIVDAMHKYGEGDVIRSLIAQKALDINFDNAPNISQNQEVKRPTRKQATAFVETVLEQDDLELDSELDSEPEIQEQEQPKSFKIPVKQHEHQAEPKQDVVTEQKVIVKTEPEKESAVEDNDNDKDEEEPYDPIQILLNDAGSSLN